jgi:CDP-glycerol glycerophosphotransferase (TagB/SpsB family)
MKINFSLGKEWSELKKFEKLSDSERSIVFYAENMASMNHFRLLINHLTKEMNLKICYVTSFKDDPIFLDTNTNINSFFIGNGTVRTKFFLTLKAKILIMDMPDLETYHIKRSKVFPVHYIYIFHSMFSIHSYLRKGAVDNFDTIFCVGEHHVKEILEIEKIYDLKPKKLVKYGFGRLDTLLDEKNEVGENNFEKRLIIMTPTYGKENFLEICGIEIIDILLESNFKVLLRPHFRIFQETPELIDEINKKFQNHKNFRLEEGVISKEDFHSSKCLISDWSGISMEYAFVFERPVIYIDVPQKIMNDEMKRIPLIPLEVSIREKIGHLVDIKKLDQLPEIIHEIDNENSEEIKKFCSETVFNIGKSAKVGAEYIKKKLDS